MSAQNTGSLVMDVKAGERVEINGGAIVVELLEKSGRTARLCVHAPRDMAIEKIRESGEEAGPGLAPCMP